MTANLKQAAEYDNGDFIAVVACAQRDEKVMGPAKDLLIERGCDHFIETEIFNPETKKKIIRIDGYKKHQQG